MGPRVVTAASAVRRPVDLPATEISVADARAIAVRAQGLSSGVLPLRPSQSARASLTRRVAAVGDTLRLLGAVQLDTISVLARSHELVQYARLGPVGRDAIEQAYWGGGVGNAHPGVASAFEYWSHAACVLPIEEWSSFAYRRRSYRRLGIRWHDVPTAALEGIRDRLRTEGPLTSTDLGGAKKGGEWWDWSETKVAVEWLLDIGDVVCVRRTGWRRVYDLAERAVPGEHRTPSPGWVDVDGVYGPSDADCVRELLIRSARVLGVGSLIDLIDVHRLTGRHMARSFVEQVLNELVDDGSIAKVRVEGWSAAAYADPLALGFGTVSRSRTTLLSPFDSLVWHRGRTSRLFGFDYQLEAYVPSHKRVHGYFTMPVLHGGKLVARVDPKRIGSNLHARQVTFEAGPRGAIPTSSINGVAAALREAAAWVGATDVVIDRTVPESAVAALRGALL